MHINVHGSTVYNSQGMEQTEMSINRGMNKDKELCSMFCNNLNGTKESEK